MTHDVVVLRNVPTAHPFLYNRAVPDQSQGTYIKSNATRAVPPFRKRLFTRISLISANDHCTKADLCVSALA